MSTINDKLNKLIDTKSAIKDALIAKGQTVSDTDTFASYADKIGNILTPVDGSIVTRTADDLTTSGNTVEVPAGYYATEASKSVDTVVQATPSISVDQSGVITATSSQDAGWVEAGEKSATQNLSTETGGTFTPSTEDQTAASAGKYLLSDITIAGDTNLVASNIKSGTTIFGVTGTYVPVFA